MLGMLPQDLNSVQLRTVGRQIVQVQPVFGLLTPLLLHQVALVDAGIVYQDDAMNRMGLERNLIEKGDHVFACRWPLLSHPNQRAAMAQGTKHIHALSMRERFDGSDLANLAPAVLHGRIRAEA